MPTSIHRGRTRPDPVSCQLCRIKKLKCNRVHPCSNCTARGITCTFLVPPQKSAGESSSIRSNEELLRRIETLESLILQAPPFSIHPAGVSDDSFLMPQEAILPGVQNVLAPEIHRNRDEDSHLLENIGTREDAVLPKLSNDMSFQIRSTREIIAIEGAMLGPARSSDLLHSSEFLVTFPEYKMAVLLFQNYETSIDQVSGILHNPTVRSMIKCTYLQLDHGSSVLPGPAALLLAIYSLSAIFLCPSEHADILSNGEDAINLAKAFGRSALDMLDYSRRNTSGTLEDIQAYILMSYATFHLDGFSARGRLLFAAGSALARDLGLHRIDAGPEPRSEHEASIRDLIDREVKRRVFWHLASHEWLTAAISGPQEGVYSIHPNHIGVRLPRDADDDEYVSGDSDQSVRVLKPTSTTYFLQKVKLAHICREIVDTVPLDAIKLRELPYEKVVALDKKLTDFISDLPFFFKLDPESRKLSQPLEAMYPNISMQRHCLTGAIHSRRCKLHQRFLLRRSSDPRYAFSRRACVESARTVMRFYQGGSGQDPPGYVRHRQGISMHYMHLALVVLVMDLCFNRDEADEAAIKEEVRIGLQVLEEVQQHSPLLHRFFSSLSQILQKHNVYLPKSSRSATQGIAPNAEQPDSLAAMPGSTSPNVVLGPAAWDAVDTMGEDFQPSFDEFWETTLQAQPNPDPLVWDNLFSALDTRPI